MRWTVRDSSTVCMFDRLPAGEHAIEIRLRAIHRGHYHSGLVRAVSMLSPEFSYHAKGRAFEVG